MRMPPSRGGGGSLWNSDVVAGVAFHPRRCPRRSGSGGNAVWYDGDLEMGDGARLAYRLYTPSSGGRSGTGSILFYFHANAEVCTDLEAEIGSFFACGFDAVVCPEFRGYAWSTGKPSLASLGPDAEAFVKALPSLLAAAGIEGLSDATLVAHGRSLGTACAVHIAAEPSCNVSGLVFESGLVSLLELPMVRQMASMMPGVLEMLSAEPDPLRMLEKLRKVSIPTLVVHGNRDEIVPVSQAVTAHKACGSMVKKLTRYPSCGHNDVRHTSAKAFFQDLELLRKVAAGDVGSDALCEPVVASSGGGFFGALRCIPGVRRCLSGEEVV
eukprot:TRINITY_DN33087_c0_g1_i1.p1 TRINITY_DN33087_c0_g1~~TRINITY_DN33087_c0_g1_i1.p1  ORF type:complete len:326 (-),score=81.15 TRINITY_DN33087_c0_g1_i1:149-1126(-)